METTPYIWLNGEFVDWDSAKIHVMSHALHYGSGVFEGLRVYNTAKGPAIFRLKDHTSRLFYSASALKMNIQYSQEELNEAHIALIKKNGLKQGYIRPIAFYGYGKFGVNPKGAMVNTAIACWPWGAYLPGEAIDIQISKFVRIHPKSTICDAKITGHYVNSIMAVQALEGTEYQEALLLDFEGNIAEGPGENFFIVKDSVIYTPKLGTILKGITRSTVFDIAKSKGYTIVEKVITPDEAFIADEAFFTGSAAEVTPIRSIDNAIIGSGKPGPITLDIKNTFLDITNGRNAEFEHLLTYCV